MFKMTRTTALAAAIAGLSIATAPAPSQAQSYQIDCAILLCLSGGWPASAPCARAKAEFIRRITPWPVEPPLQIWRCPMGASFQIDPSDMNATRLYDILQDGAAPAPLQSTPAKMPDALTPQPAIIRSNGGDAQRLPEGFMLQLIQEGEFSDESGTADIDISDPAFDFVRSIRVYHVSARQWYQGGDADECRRSGGVNLGTYGAQGDFHWGRGSPYELPEAHSGMERYGEDCPRFSHRSVFVDWTDYAGNYGYEQVNY